MKVELINYTQDALNLLLRTKNTRLANDSDPEKWGNEQKIEHLDYMLKTIKSSWEFVDYTFKIDGVTRAFTHQFVRTRQGSYAQESMRTVNVKNRKVLRPKMDDNQYGIWETGEAEAMEAYEYLTTQTGMSVQDARGLLPTNVTTSIIAKFNLRTLHEMAKVRMCRRTQGEYQRVFRAMNNEVVAVHPWADRFLQVACVADGVCAFPKYGEAECDVYDTGMDQTAVKKRAYIKFWGSDVKEAVPVAKDGKTM